ncbi:MAG: hypothetical protein ABII27_03020 [bacterium]
MPREQGKVISKKSLSIGAIVLSLVGGWAFFYLRYSTDRVSLVIGTAKSNYTPGETVKCDVQLTPLSPIPYKGLLSVTIVAPEREYIMPALFYDLKNLATQNRVLEFDIPEDEPFGRYIIMSRFKLILDDEDIQDIIQQQNYFYVKKPEVHVEKSPVKVRSNPEQPKKARKFMPLPDSNNKEGLKMALYADDILGQFAFDEKIDLGGTIKNYSKNKVNVNIELRVVLPDSTKKSFSALETLLPEETKHFNFVYVPSKDKSPGRYTASFELYSDNIRLDATDVNFYLFDREPQVTLKKFPFKSLVGKKETIEIEANDDKEIKEVSIFYYLPRQKKMEKENMILIKGDRLKGIWKYKTKEFDDTGKYKFYILAKDNFNQEYQTKMYSMKIKED